MHTWEPKTKRVTKPLLDFVGVVSFKRQPVTTYLGNTQRPRQAYSSVNIVALPLSVSSCLFKGKISPPRNEPRHLLVARRRFQAAQSTASTASAPSAAGASSVLPLAAAGAVAAVAGRAGGETPLGQREMGPPEWILVVSLWFPYQQGDNL